jgi:O-antigen/teichoic acid export membrane protein
LAQSASRKLLAQSSHYSIASLFTLIAGAMTFPMLTRVLSVRDYGIMSLLGATLSLSVALGKTGLQHAIVRYYSEITAGKSRFSLSQLASTAVLGMSASGLIVMIGLVLGAQLVPLRWIQEERVRGLLVLVAVLALVQVLDSMFTNMLRAAQRTTALMKYQIAKKYLTLGLLFGGMLLIARSLWTYYSALLFAEGVVLIVLVRVVLKEDPETRPHPDRFSRPLYAELLRYGLPMTFGYELAGVILSVGDRYVIKGVIGEEQVGLYAAAYNLCQYVQSVFITSVGDAITPIYMKMYDQEGPEKTRAFTGQSLRNYFLLAAPVIAGVASVGPELLPALASERYASAGGVFPWVMAGMVVDGAATIVGAGLFIHRKTTLMMIAVAGSAAINVVANLLLVPRFGIVGAAAATLIGYVSIYLAFTIGARRYLAVPVPWGTLVRAVLAAVIMYVALSYVLPGKRFITVGARGVLGIIIYAAVIAVIDANGRDFVRRGLRRVRSRLGI